MGGTEISDAGEELFALARVLGRGRGRAATTGADVAVWGSEPSVLKALSVGGGSVAPRRVAAAAARVGGLADTIDGMLWDAHHRFLKKYV